MSVVTAPLVCFPMRLDWELHQPPAVRQPFPAPLIASTQGYRPPDTPGAVAGLQGAAERAGWATLLQYAYGFYPHARTGVPGAAPKESFALRMRRVHEGAVAVYVRGSTWSWEYLYAWSPRRPWTKFTTLGELRKVLES